MQNEPLAAYCINARKQEDDHMTRQIITDNVFLFQPSKNISIPKALSGMTRAETPSHPNFRLTSSARYSAVPSTPRNELSIRRCLNRGSEGMYPA